MPSKSKGGFQLTEGDIEFLKHIYQLRLAHIEHLRVLTGRSRRVINNRLVKLTQRRYLYRIRLPFQKYVYTIHKNSAPILVELGIAPKEIIDLRVRLRENSQLFLRHALMLVDLHVALILACRNSHIKLIKWVQGKELYDSVTIMEDSKRKNLPVRPDAYLVLEDLRRPQGQNRAHFFLEADRSTTTHKRFQRKIQAYWHYYKEGLYIKKYGIKAFRVLTITLTKERAENLCEAASEVLPAGAGKFYYFTPVSSFSLKNPARIFEDIFITPRNCQEDVRHRLIPPLVAQAAAT